MTSTIVRRAAPPAVLDALRPIFSVRLKQQKARLFCRAGFVVVQPVVRTDWLAFPGPPTARGRQSGCWTQLPMRLAWQPVF